MQKQKYWSVMENIPHMREDEFKYENKILNNHYRALGYNEAMLYVLRNKKTTTEEDNNLLLEDIKQMEKNVKFQHGIIEGWERYIQNTLKEPKRNYIKGKLNG